MKNERAFIILGMIFLLALSSIIMATALRTSATSVQTTYTAKARLDSYYASEDSLNRAIAWLRDSSANMGTPFSRDNFYNLFDKTSPSAGDNEIGTSGFSVPTKIKFRGTSNSAILSNSTVIGSSLFPDGEFTNGAEAIIGSLFETTDEFAAGNFGSAVVRITLVDVIANEPAKDYGDPDDGFAAPETDFHPVYRIDAMNATDQGSHVFAYLRGQLQMGGGFGFYGRDYVDMRQTCDSYSSLSGTYDPSTPNANCGVGSWGTVSIHDQETLWGSVQTTGSITASSPYGGDVCADFITGCPNPGTVCEGSDCSVPGLPDYDTWEEYCPTNQGTFNGGGNDYAGAVVKTVAGDQPIQKCWSEFTIGNGKHVKLTTTTQPYFFETLNLGNTNSRLYLEPIPATGTIEIYVKNIGTNDTLNGNLFVANTIRPTQLRIHYLGTDQLTLNGTAAINAFITSPNAPVQVSGTFDYYGGIRATGLTMTGTGNLHYDESGNDVFISDVRYKVRKFGQHYR
jgi:hypothetical protein